MAKSRRIRWKEIAVDEKMKVKLMEWGNLGGDEKSFYGGLHQYHPVWAHWTMGPGLWTIKRNGNSYAAAALSLLRWLSL